jgi:hypothetical protein
MKKWILLFSVLLVSFGLAKVPENVLKKTSAYSGCKTLCNISNWACWVYDNGQSAHSPDGSSGGIYPKGTATAIYQDGFIWGGKVDTDGDGVGDRIRVGGQQYNIGTVPGWVINGGDVADALVADPGDPAVRVYRIRSDYQHMSDSELIEDAALQNQVYQTQVTDDMKQAVIAQYQQDWEEWPVEHGAPFYDKDGDGIYTAGVDEPGIANAHQVLWLVVNDYDRIFTTAMFGSEPIGLELQITIWAYDDKESRFGQTIFKSYKLINKSNSIVEDMYINQWSDPDIGSASNDYVGCDTLLELGYAYNGDNTDFDYDAYGLPPAAAGYVLLQGPMVASPGDTAIYELNEVPDHKNLPMTSFGWFAAGSALDDPELGDYVGTLQYYNMMRGYKPTEDEIPVPWTLGNVAGAAETKYPLHGDPTIPGASEVDGTESYFTPGDRRMCVSSGPFHLAPGGTQEVMFALVGGIGDDNLSSISELKTNAQLARLLHEGKFENVSRAPEYPKVISRYFEKTAILEWGSDLESVEAIEGYSIAGYEFEGYNIYQLPDSMSTQLEATRIATFDIVNDIKIINDTRYLREFLYASAEVPVAFGNDTGIRHYIKIDWDYINNCQLYEGKTYYYAVTSYNQNISEERMGLKMYESIFIPHSLTLQEELPGNKLRSYVGQSDFPVEHTAGNSEGAVCVKVVDPYAIKGIDYKIKFELNKDSSEVLFSVWEVRQDASDYLLSSGNALQRDTLVYNAAPIVDGLEIKVLSPSQGIAEVVQPDAHGSSTIVDGDVWHSLQANGDGSEPWHRAAGAPWMLMDSRSGDLNGEFSDNVPDRFKTWGTSDFEIVFGDSSVAWSYMYDICLTEKVPFAIYKYDVDGTVERQFVVIYDSQVSGTDGTWDQGIESSFTATSGYEEIYCYGNGGTGYQVADEAAYIAANDIYAAPSLTGWDAPGNPVGYPYINRLIVTMYPEGTTGPPVNGTVIRFNTKKPLNVDDEFYFSTAGYEPINNDSLMQDAIDKINVFPNPYYGIEKTRDANYPRYVTFTHLPPKACIKIFNLAGVLVNTIYHDNPNSQFEIWTLGNQSGIRVGSGMYIVHISMPDEEREKILKLMVVRGGIY